MKHLIISFALLFIVGCGSAVESGDPQQSSASQSAAAENAAETAAANLPEPTADQIAAWTTAAFEPLELLAVREWEKTSFSACLAGLPDGKQFLVAGSRVLLWSLTGDEPEHVFLDLTESEEECDARAIGVAPDGKWFVVGDSLGHVHLWTLVDRKLVATKELSTTGIQDVAISPDGSEIATITYTKTITIASATDLAVKKTFDVDTTGVARIEYMAPGVLAVAGESTSSWNTSTGAKEKELSPGRYSKALGRSPDGSTFIFGGDEKLVIWNVKEDKPVGEFTWGVSGSERLAFSPDGKFLATTNNQDVLIWNLAERRLVQFIDNFAWPVVGASWLPETNLLVLASDIGINRIWGTPENGAAAGFKPLHSPLTKFDIPATPIQMRQVIDLRVLPRLPNSEMSISGTRDLSYTTHATIPEAIAFYKYQLEKLGWTAVKAKLENPAGVEFDKNGFRLAVSLYGAEDGKTSVSLNHRGNFDLRTVPKFNGAEIEPNYETADTVSYHTKADLLAIETNLLRTLTKAGWTAYTRIHTSHSEQPDSRDFEFIKNGTTLRVSIGKFPLYPDGYTVQYSLFPVDASVPIPTDAGYVEFDGSTDPKLIAITGMDLTQARAFYRDEMAKEGWLAREDGESEEKDRAWTTFLHGQNDVTVGFSKLPSGKVLVRVGEVSGSLFENSLPPEKEEEEKPAEQVVDEQVVGIEAADFPMLNASQTGKYDTIEKTLLVVFENSSLADAAEVYTKELESRGWKRANFEIREKEYTFLTFEKGEVEIVLRAHPKSGNAEVSFAGDGLLWTKPLPESKEIVSYERWLRINKLPPSLDTLDKFESEMRANVPTGNSKP